MSTTHPTAAVQAATGQRKHVLEEAESERIFRDRIVPDELTGTPQDHPVVVIVAGQPGDGKATITALARGVLNRRGRPVTISPDRYEPHPSQLPRAARGRTDDSWPALQH